MDRFTDKMTRLVNEIKDGHTSREQFLQKLEQNVAEMRTNFRNAHFNMAQRTKAERLKFIQDLQKMVLHLRQESRHWQAEVAADLAGAREAWRTLQQ